MEIDRPLDCQGRSMDENEIAEVLLLFHYLEELFSALGVGIGKGQGRNV